MTLIRTQTPTPENMNLFLGSLAFAGLIIAALHFIVNNYVLSTKLNLE